MWWNEVFAGHITFRDRDFVGDDPVLTAELKRRLARSSPPAEVYSEPNAMDKNGSLLSRAGSDSLDGLLTGSRRFGYWDLTHQENQNKKKGYGHEPEYVRYEKDPNATNLYAMHLKVAEQAIYGVQQRLEDMERMMEPYQDNTFMRMAFVLRRVDVWQREMVDFLDYSHRQLHYGSGWGSWATPMSSENPWWFPNIRHIMYYQAILRRYIDIVYSLEFLRKLHREEMRLAHEKMAEMDPDPGKKNKEDAPPMGFDMLMQPGAG